MTEDEAKTKWCPFVRVVPTFEPRDELAGVRCIASACMAWRWTGYRAEDGTWVRRTVGEPWSPERADGLCGLAGAQP